MKKILLILLVFMAACTAQKLDFKYALTQLEGVNAKYATTMETYPDTKEKADSMTADLAALKKLDLDSQKQAFDYLLDFRMLNLEAEKLYMESLKYGDLGNTKKGFGCKSRPIIQASASLRDQSASKATQAIDTLRKLVKEYPSEAASANLAEKNAIFLNATFYEIEKNARSDLKVISSFCPENVTLNLYKEELKTKSIVSDDVIAKLTYDEAVVLWKKERGYDKWD